MTVEYVGNQAINPNTDYIGFFVALDPSCMEQLENFVQEHKPNIQYLIVGERAEGVHHETNGYHYHVMANLTEKEYRSLMAKINRMYKLRGQARDGKARQYGKIKEALGDPFRMMCYMFKAPHQWGSNFYMTILDKAMEEAYVPKPRLKSTKYQIYDAIEKRLNGVQHAYCFKDKDYIVPNSIWDDTVHFNKGREMRRLARLAIVEFYQDNDIVPTRQAIQRYTVGYFLLKENWSAGYVIDLFFPE